MSISNNFQIVKDEIVLEFFWGDVWPPSKPIISLRSDASEDDIVTTARKVAIEYSRGNAGEKHSLINGFAANRVITANLTLVGIGQHAVTSVKPIKIHPISYFGVVVPPNVKPNNHGIYRNKNAVLTETKTCIPLGPGHRVYSLSTGKLLHAEPT